MGLSPDEVVRHLTESDPGRDRRQLAVIDNQGRVRAYTGSGTSAWIVKGNMVYYLKFEQKFESVRIFGPEELEE